MKFFWHIVLLLLIGNQTMATDFAHEVMPILKQHCAECHTGGEKKGGLAMNTRAEFLAGGEGGEIAVPGSVVDSFFIDLIESDDDTEWMPPKGPRLTSAEVAVLKKWVEDDMPWPENIALGEKSWQPPLKPRKVELPPAVANRNHPIDRLLDSGLTKQNKPLPQPISDATFLRRVYLDAVGMLPDPETLSDFLNDPATDKRTQLINQLLADDISYADHWLTFWNDLLRNDYTGTGFITKGRTQITDWLYTSLRDNKPYDQFVREVLAPKTEASAGFINGIKWRGEVNASQTLDVQFSQNISQVFLGINMKCASCHDSFIDDWKLEDAYNLAAIFSDKPLEMNRCDVPTGEIAEPKWIFPELGDIDPKAPKQQRLEQLSELMTHPENGRFTRTVVNRIWERLMGRGIVHPVDAMDTKPWNGDLLDFLAIQFTEQKYDLREFISFVMTSQAYQSKSEILETRHGENYTYAGPVTRRLTAEQLIDAIWQITDTNPSRADADVDRVIDQVTTTDRAAITPYEVTAKWLWHSGDPGEKSQLRKTIAFPSIPQRALLMATCDNAFKLKINGSPITQSKEWTLPRYINVSTHLKAGDNLFEVDAEMFGGGFGFICEIIVIDANGNQHSLITDKTWQARPPGGQWAQAKELHEHGKGPWKFPLNPADALSGRNGVTPPVRASLVKNNFLMRSLGRPSRDQVVTSRPSELSTLQAIDLANGDIFADYLKSGANSLINSGKVTTDFSSWLFQYAYSRQPTKEESNLIEEILGDGSDPLAIEDILWLLVMQPEFQLNR